MCIQGTEAWAKKTGIPVEIFSTPNDSNDRLALYQQLLGAKSKDIDVYQVDVVWPGILAPHLLDLGPFFSPEEKAAHLPEAIRNNRVNDRLVAIPWFADAGALYYRKDLLAKHGLKVPATWQELGAAAKTVLEKERAAGNTDLQGLVFQGRAYEGLSCNALEWIASHGGGTVVEEDGRVSVNNPKAAAGLALIASWIGNIVPRGVLSYSEEEARGAFQAGKVVFMRNWPYAWALLTAPESGVKDKVGIAPLPKGADGRPAATLGGWGLAVSAYTASPKEAAELVKFLTSYEQQKTRAIQASFNPTLTALYDDKDLLAKNPHLKYLKAAFVSAVPRPARQTKTKYNRVSSDFWNSVHSLLSGSGKPEDSLKALETRIAGYSNNGRW